MINPSACVNIPISSRDVGVQASSPPGAIRQRIVRALAILLFVAVTILLVELVRWGVGHLPTAVPSRGEEGAPGGHHTTVTTVIQTVTTTTTTTTTTEDIDGRVERFTEDLRRERLLSRLQRGQDPQHDE